MEKDWKRQHCRTGNFQGANSGVPPHFLDNLFKPKPMVWELFCLHQGFAIKNSDSSLFFPKKQWRRILNLDETKFSVDGSDGGVGGRPALFVTNVGLHWPGMATNKSSLSSMLICRSNAANDPLPMHIMCPSNAEDEWNFAVRADWVANLPRGENWHQSSPASPSVLCKTAVSWLHWYLGEASVYQNRCSPGWIDISLIAALRVKGIFLFNSIQNTTHVSQETDQNCGLFKSSLRRNTQQLIMRRLAGTMKSQGFMTWILKPIRNPMES